MSSIDGICSFCGDPYIAVYSAGGCMSWFCETCHEKKKEKARTNKNYWAGTQISSGPNTPEYVESWCKAFLKQKRADRKVRTVATYYTRV